MVNRHGSARYYYDRSLCDCFGTSTLSSSGQSRSNARATMARFWKAFLVFVREAAGPVVNGVLKQLFRLAWKFRWPSSAGSEQDELVRRERDRELGL